MEKQQLALITGSVALIALLYFGFDTKPPTQKLIEKSRAGNVELEETQNLLHEAKADLPTDVRKYLQGLENLAEGSSEDSVRIPAMKSLSAAWYERQEFAIAGYYAEQIAEITQDEAGWAIAGTTYGAALMDDSGDAHDRLAAAGAVRAFENAISLNPDNPEHRINLAICYVEHPPSDNPMKGIQLLLDLNRNYPENISVLYHLARFGMRTGQYDKAMERLETALAINPDQKRLNCLMAELLRETGQTDRVSEFEVKC